MADIPPPEIADLDPLPEGYEPTNIVVIVCLIIVGALGVTGAAGGICLIWIGAPAAEALAVFGLGTGALTGVLGFMTGRASVKAA